MGVIGWEDPPPVVKDAGGSWVKVHDWESIAADLKSRPGRWAIATVCRNRGVASQVANAVRTGEYEVLRRQGPFEAVARQVDGEARVYARFLLDPGGEAAREAPQKGSSND